MKMTSVQLNDYSLSQSEHVPQATQLFPNLSGILGDLTQAAPDMDCPMFYPRERFTNDLEPYS